MLAMMYSSAEDNLASREERFYRIPKGETVALALEPRSPVPLLLGKHRFYLLSDEGLRLLDQNGGDFDLRSGKNVIGRDARCTLIIQDGFEDVSRKHLIVETEGETLVRLTDISSLGTFVSSEYLTHRL